MSSKGITHTHGGGIDQTAVIGHAPEGREWAPGDRTLPPYVSPTARIETYVTIDAGMERATRIAAGVWLMKHVHVGHDAEIGEGTEIAPGAVVGGHATIGRNVKVGINASILPLITIGDGARVGAGAVVTRDVPPGAVVAGNPARPLNRETAPGELRLNRKLAPGSSLVAPAYLSA